MNSGDAAAAEDHENGHIEGDVDKEGGRGRGQASCERLYKCPRHQLWGKYAHLSGPEEAVF